MHRRGFAWLNPLRWHKKSKRSRRELMPSYLRHRRARGKSRMRSRRKRYRDRNCFRASKELSVFTAPCMWSHCRLARSWRKIVLVAQSFGACVTKEGLRIVKIVGLMCGIGRRPGKRVPMFTRPLEHHCRLARTFDVNVHVRPSECRK